MFGQLIENVRQVEEMFGQVRKMFGDFICSELLFRHFERHIFLSPQKKVLIRFLRPSSTCFGIPCTRARYCVRPPITIWMISFRPSVVGWPLSHRSKSPSMLSRAGVHGDSWFPLFPSHAPRMRVSSPSGTIFMVLGIIWTLYPRRGSGHALTIPFTAVCLRSLQVSSLRCTPCSSLTAPYLMPSLFGPPC